MSCVDGKYSPTAPERFICEPAVAVILTDQGHMEIFSEDGQCPKTISNVPPFAAAGQMVNLLNNKLQVLALSDTEKVWISSSMENPLGGI